jgi:hypothetical protein
MGCGRGLGIFSRRSKGLGRQIYLPERESSGGIALGIELTDPPRTI